MATWFAQNSSVNIDSVNQWNSAANGSGSWLTFAALDPTDVLMWNGRTAITINVNVTCASLRSTTFGGATTNGTGTISTGVVITADIYCATSSSFLTISGSADVTLIGTVYGTSVSNYGLIMSSSGSLTITGNIVSDTLSYAFYQTSGVVNLTGNITNTNSSGSLWLYRIDSGTLNVTGNVVGGAGNNAPAIYSAGGTCTVNVIGNVTGGAQSEGIRLVSGTLTVKVTGNCIASTWPAIGASLNPTNGKVLLYGDTISSLTGAVGIAMPCLLLNPAGTLTHTYRVDSSGSAGIARSLFTGGTNLGQPTQANVRHATAFGASNEFTGSLRVPDPSYVSQGVLTDATMGTLVASLDAAAVRAAIGMASANLDTQLTAISNKLPALVGGRVDASVGAVAADAINAAAIADGAIDTATFAAGTTIPRVTLADTVTTNTDMRGTDGANTIAPTNLSALQVRTELATELGRIDASISSRSTFAGGAVASVTAAVELDSASVTAVQSGLATSAAVTAVAGDVTTLLGRVTATVATLWGALVEMISGTTPNRRFTAKALELGPGGAGGGDATAANQVAILAALTGVEVIQVASPNVSGNLVLTQGDTYDGIANAKASWVVATDYTTGWAVLLTIRDSNDVLVYAVAGTVASATSITVSIIAPTGLTMTGCPGQWQGKFDVQLTKTGSIKTIALGACYINEDQSR